LIVSLVVKKRLDLLEKLLENSRVAFPKDNIGVAHKIVGRTDLGDCLGNKDAVQLLVKNGVTNIDPENYLEDKAEEMVKRFKEEGGCEEVTAVKEELWYYGYQRESEAWSDRLANQTISGFQIKIEEYGSISEMRIRHGSEWQPWRRTGWGGEGSVQEAFELEENEVVVSVRTNTQGFGWLRGLEVTTSTGRQVSWGDLDKDFNKGQKRRSVVENAKLAFCSGLVEIGGDCRSITFHWILDETKAGV
jgi:hypothetical protein